MFPLNDFNFVACAIATVSAAVGYNVSRRRGRHTGSKHAESERTGPYSRFGFLNFHRRRNSTASARSTSLAPTESDGSASEPPVSNCGTPVSAEYESLSDEVEDGSLKRKRTPTPQAVAIQQQHSDVPPSKRRRTPPIDEKEVRGIKVEDSVVVARLEETTFKLPVPEHEAVLACQDVAVPSVGSEPSFPPVSEATVTVIKSPTNLEASVSVPSPPATPPLAPATKNVILATSPVRVSTLSSPWHTNTRIVAAKPSSAFQAFSGKSSAFANSASADSPKAPVWSTRSDECHDSAFGDTTGALADPLEASAHETSTHKVVTGEEDEHVENELKGAKVFIKRGDRDFCEGIFGNVRLLKHKETGDVRILFRREPVWKVTMSVRLRPTVRCSFDEAQCALRVMLIERIEETQMEQVVVYALKRGKASRADFAEFATAAVESARSQEQPYT